MVVAAAATAGRRYWTGLGQGPWSQQRRSDSDPGCNGTLPAGWMFGQIPWRAGPAGGRPGTVDYPV